MCINNCNIGSCTLSAILQCLTIISQHVLIHALMFLSHLPTLNYQGKYLGCVSFCFWCILWVSQYLWLLCSIHWAFTTIPDHHTKLPVDMLNVSFCVGCILWLSPSVSWLSNGVSHSSCSGHFPVFLSHLMLSHNHLAVSCDHLLIASHCFLAISNCLILYLYM